MSSIFELAITLAVKMTIQQSAVSFSIQLPMVCVCVCVGKTHNMLQQYGMYCYRLMCNRGNNWMTKSKKYLAMFP